jgi:hypothetical protein
VHQSWPRSSSVARGYQLTFSSTPSTAQEPSKRKSDEQQAKMSGSDDNRGRKSTLWSYVASDIVETALFTLRMGTILSTFIFVICSLGCDCGSPCGVLSELSHILLTTQDIWTVHVHGIPQWHDVCLPHIRLKTVPAQERGTGACGSILTFCLHFLFHPGLSPE